VNLNDYSPYEPNIYDNNSKYYDNPKEIVDNFFKSPISEHIYSQYKDNQSINNSSINIVNPPTDKLKWDDNSDYTKSNQRNNDYGYTFNNFDMSKYKKYDETVNREVLVRNNDR